MNSNFMRILALFYGSMIILIALCCIAYLIVAEDLTVGRLIVLLIVIAFGATQMKIAIDGDDDQ